MLNITYLTGEYPPMQGGIADYTAHLIHHLTPLGVAPTVITSQRWSQSGAAHNPLAVDSTHLHLIPDWGWSCWRQIHHHIQKNQPTALHIQYQAAMYDLGGWVNWLPCYLKWRGVATRIVTTFHDLRIPYLFPKAGRLRWWSVLALAKYSDAIICTNQADADTLKQHGLSSHVIPLGNNISPHLPPNFDRAAWRRRYQADAATLLLAHFGFLNESKGVEELLESVARLRQQGVAVRLLLLGGEVGDADPTNVAYAHRIRGLIAQHNLADCVEQTGYLDETAISATLTAADAVVLPYRDGVSFRRTTLIAALRHGCPIVSTQPTTPIPQIRPNESLLLAQPRDATSLAATLHQLVNAPELRQRLSQAAQQLGSLFEWSHIAKQTISVYKREK